MKGGSIIEETYKTNQPGSCSRDVDICNKCFGIYTSVYISYEYVLCTWKRPNCGYAATKDDNEAIAYITMTRYKINSGTPQISMWLPQAEHMLRQPMPGHGLEQLLANH